MRVPNNTNIPLLAGDAVKALGDDLDAFLLGNASSDLSPPSIVGADMERVVQEPDLYTGHGQRPNLKNYTVDDYVGVRPALHS